MKKIVASGTASWNSREGWEIKTKAKRKSNFLLIFLIITELSNKVIKLRTEDRR